MVPGMHASRRTAVALGIAALLVASLAVAQPARANMGRPSWAAGDFWVYALSSAGPGGVNANATLRLDVRGTEQIVVNGTSYSTYRVAALVSVVLVGTTTFPADLWYSTDTLALVKARATVEITVPGLHVSGTVEVFGNPPQTIRWPLTAGAQWQSTTTVWTVMTNASGTTYASAPLTTDFAVMADATVSVPAGTFATTPVNESNPLGGGSYQINYWSPQVGNWARVAQYNGTGGNEGNFNLTGWNYQGGFFLTAVLLGLPTWVWLIVVAAVVVVVAIAVRRRRRRPAAQTMPPVEPPP